MRRLCRGNQAEELASRFLELSAATPNFTACPSKHWLTKLQGEWWVSALQMYAGCHM